MAILSATSKTLLALDNDVFTDWRNRRPHIVKSRVLMEQMIKDCGVLEISDRATAIASHIFARLSASERNRNRADVFIIATARAHGYGVATRNQSDFESIGQHLPSFAPDLYLAIWKT